MTSLRPVSNEGDLCFYLCLSVRVYVLDYLMAFEHERTWIKFFRMIAWQK